MMTGRTKQTQRKFVSSRKLHRCHRPTNRGPGKTVNFRKKGRVHIEIIGSGKPRNVIFCVRPQNPGIFDLGWNRPFYLDSRLLFQLLHGTADSLRAFGMTGSSIGSAPLVSDDVHIGCRSDFVVRKKLKVNTQPAVALESMAKRWVESLLLLIWLSLMVMARVS
jgi:hypothetical protein